MYQGCRYFVLLKGPGVSLSGGLSFFQGDKDKQTIGEIVIRAFVIRAFDTAFHLLILTF